MADSVVWMISRAGAYDRNLQRHLLQSGFIVNGLEARQGPVPQLTGVPAILLVDIADTQDCWDMLDWLAASRLPKLFMLPPEDEALDTFVLIHDIDSFVIKPCLSESVERHLQILLHKYFPEAFGNVERPRRDEPERIANEDRLNPQQSAGVNIDDQAKTAIVEGRVVDLTPKEFALLRLLSSRPGRVFSNEEIIESVWSGSRRASSLDVQQYVHHLRRKVEDNPHHPRWIKNVKGFGYKLDRQLPV